MPDSNGEVRVIVSGVNGRIGAAITRLAGEDAGVKVLGGLVSDGSKCGGAPAGVRCAEHLAELLGDDVSSNAAPAETSAGGWRWPVLIDFTEPNASLARLDEARELGVAVVIGTTGFDATQRQQIEAAAREIPVLLSANTSLGVNVLLEVVRDLAARLQGYDIEIMETHHRMKKDAPSGTALALARAAAGGRQMALEDVARYGREGATGTRSAEEIGIHAVRGGDVVGDHTVLFAGPGERVEITHKASSRDTFAAGALLAARFVARQEPGMYTMADVLNAQRG